MPEEIRGTYAGLAHPAAVEHLARLGVSAVELMPVHQFDTGGRAGEAGRELEPKVTLELEARSVAVLRAPR